MTEKLTEAAVSEQPLDDKRRQLVQEVYERFEVFSQGCKTYHEEAGRRTALLTKSLRWALTRAAASAATGCKRTPA